MELKTKSGVRLDVSYCEPICWGKDKKSAKQVAVLVHIHGPNDLKIDHAGILTKESLNEIKKWAKHMAKGFNGRSMVISSGRTTYWAHGINIVFEIK